MLIPLVIAFSVATAVPIEKARNFTNYRLISGHLPSLKSFEVVENLSNEGHLELWSDLPSEDGSILFSVGPDSYKKVVSSLTRFGIKTNVLEDDLQKVIDEERSGLTYALSIPRPLNLHQFESYDQIVASIEFYAEEPSGHISSFVIGKSSEDRDIVGIKISNSAEKKPIVFLECGIHAREWASPSTCAYIIDQFVSHQEQHNDLLDRYIYINI